MTPLLKWKNARKKKRQLVQKEVRKAEKEGRQARAIGIQQQGAWMRWEGTQYRRVTWQAIWKLEESQIPVKGCL
jgi:hypothetical protein